MRVVVESGDIILHFFVVPLSLPFARTNGHKVELKAIIYYRYASVNQQHYHNSIGTLAKLLNSNS